jgi:hypothetical protein
MAQFDQNGIVYGRACYLKLPLTPLLGLLADFSTRSTRSSCRMRIDTNMAPKLILTLNKSAERELADRAERMKPQGPPMQQNPKELAIHFLRGVHSRATMALPAFYLFLGTNVDGTQACAIEGYPGLIFKGALNFSSIGTVTLSCRKVFDHAKGLTGASFAKTSDEILKEVAEYWSKSSCRPVQEAFAALSLLKSIFRDCSKTDTALFDAKFLLGRRIGLLKQYANRSAAHLSLESHEFSTLDCAHVVAALTMIGEIIRSFDDSHALPTYFDTLDEASLSAARHLFPATPNIRLFQDIKIETQSRLCWQWGVEQGREMLLEKLPYAIGWY